MTQLFFVLRSRGRSRALAKKIMRTEARGRLTWRCARTDRRRQAQPPGFLWCRRSCGCGRPTRRRSFPSSFQRLLEGTACLAQYKAPPRVDCSWSACSPLPPHPVLASPYIVLTPSRCMLHRRLFVLGYFGGACSVVAMAATGEAPSKNGQPLTVEGVDDRAFREPTLPHAYTYTYTHTYTYTSI
jgi:hypothetical protein